MAKNGASIDAQHLFPSLKFDRDSQVISQSGSLMNNVQPTSTQANEDQSEHWIEEAINQMGTMEKIEEAILKHVIVKAEFNISEAARRLKMSRPTFSYRLKKLNIEI